MLIRAPRQAPRVLETRLAYIQRERIIGIPIAMEDIFQVLPYIVPSLTSDVFEHGTDTWNKHLR